MARKKKECAECGCERYSTIKATVSEPNINVTLNRLCVPCLLFLLKVPREQIEKLTPYKNWMTCIEETA